MNLQWILACVLVLSRFEPTVSFVDAAWQAGKAAAEQTARVALSAQKGMLKDQLSAGLIALRCSMKVVSFATPWLWRGLYKAGRTTVSFFLDAVWGLVQKTLIKLGFGEGFRAVRKGREGVLQLLHYLKNQKGELEKHPLITPLLLQKAVEGGSTAGQLLVPLLISYTKDILVAERGYHEIYASILVDASLPSSLLRQALTDSPLSKKGHGLVSAMNTPDCLLSGDWWVYEFMAKIVGFPPHAFREYLVVFLEFHPTLETNPLLGKLEENVPRMPKRVPKHIRYHVMFIANLRLYYLLKEPGLTRHYNWRCSQELGRVLAILEFYLDLSGAMVELRQDPASSYSKAIQRWIARVLEFSSPKASLTVIMKKVLKDDSHRVFELISRSDMSRYGPEAINQCSCWIYSRIITHTPADRRVKPPQSCCPCIRRIYKLAKMVGNNNGAYRCLDMATEVKPFVLDRNKLKKIVTPESLRELPIALGVILDATLNIERDELPLATVIQKNHGASVDYLLNESLRLRCARYGRWPAVRYCLTEEGVSGSAEAKLLSVGKSMAVTGGDRIWETRAQTKTRMVLELLNTSMNSVSMDMFACLFTHLNVRTPRVSFAGMCGLLKTSMRFRRLDIFSIIIREIVRRFARAEPEKLLGLLNFIRKEKLFRPLVKGYNYKTLGLLPSKAFK